MTVRSIYTKFVRFYWGSNKAKKRTANGRAIRRQIKRQSRRIDNRVAEQE